MKIAIGRQTAIGIATKTARLQQAKNSNKIPRMRTSPRPALVTKKVSGGGRRSNNSNCNTNPTRGRQADPSSKGGYDGVGQQRRSQGKNTISSTGCSSMGGARGAKANTKAAVGANKAGVGAKTGGTGAAQGGAVGGGDKGHRALRALRDGLEKDVKSFMEQAEKDCDATVSELLESSYGGTIGQEDDAERVGGALRDTGNVQTSVADACSALLKALDGHCATLDGLTQRHSAALDSVIQSESRKVKSNLDRAVNTKT